MSNIKSIITLKPVYGLHKDVVLTRENENDDFLYESQYAGNDHRQYTKVSFSESLLDKEHFSAIEWFNSKPKTNKEKIAELEAENVELKSKIDELESRPNDCISCDCKSDCECESDNSEKPVDKLDQLKDSIEYLTDSKLLKNIVEKLDQAKRKLDEYTKLYHSAENKLEQDMYHQDVTVYKNMLELLYSVL